MGRICISLTDWVMNAFYPYVPILQHGAELGNELRGMLKPMPAKVPGGVHLTLEKNGYISDPNYGLNSLACEWVERRWWFFTTEVVLDRLPDHPLWLEFDGLDYRCRIYWNGEELGICENMFRPFRFDVTKIATPGKNRIGVLFESVPEEMGQIGYTSQTFTQKARFGYKWDFATRLVNIGFWKPCRLREVLPNEVETFYFRPLGGGEASLTVTLAKSCPQCPIRVRLLDQGREVFLQQARCEDRQATFRISLPDVRLWYPNQAGEQALYDLEILTGQDETCLCRKKVGFKTVRLLPNETSPETDLHYVFEINGKKIYVKGVNMTPLDLRYGDIPVQKYRTLLEQLKDMNVNLIRVWGGGLIEQECFYELCDELGFLIWQEFIQSSSGIDNQPSKDKNFLKKLYESAEFATVEKRNHVSMCIWSGGNELRDAQDIPSTFEDENLRGLLEIVRKNCPHLPMLPTSASGPQEMADPGTPGKNFDVHGPWQYLGERAHYEFYNRMDSFLHSEFGTDGMTCLQSLKKFIPPESLNLETVDENLVYRHHGDWWDTVNRDKAVFGPNRDLEEKIQRSQFLQAEGIRYAVEANRRRAFQNSGSIIWQANEPFPNVSCTSLIDYYGVPKPAALALKQAYAPLNVSLKYEKLVWEKGETFTAEVFVTSDQPRAAVDYQVEVLPFKTLLSGSVDVGEGKSCRVGRVSSVIKEDQNIRIICRAKQGAKAFRGEIMLLVRKDNGFASLEKGERG